jgi:F0F1-type ATP synthase assembly protein I
MPDDQRRVSSLGDSWAKAQPYVDAAWEFIAAVGLGTAGGWWLDRKLHTQPWLLVAGSMLGFASGMWVMFRTMLNLAARDKAAERKQGGSNRKGDA